MGVNATKLWFFTDLHKKDSIRKNIKQPGIDSCEADEDEIVVVYYSMEIRALIREPKPTFVLQFVFT